jgi:hypothetical protein
MNPNPYESPQAVENRQEAIEASPSSSRWPKITVVELLVVMAISAVLFGLIQPHRPPRSLLQKCVVVGQLIAIPLSILLTALVMQFVIDRIGEMFHRSR